ncbi:MAG TPA: hypothetical protein VFY83_12075 [Anaerolineales bacterium]|nr:hypothetical protein [Anaerolineales bacterium]
MHQYTEVGYIFGYISRLALTQRSRMDNSMRGFTKQSPVTGINGEEETDITPTARTWQKPLSAWEYIFICIYFLFLYLWSFPGSNATLVNEMLKRTRQEES